MAVDVKATGNSFQASVPRALFQTRATGLDHRYAVGSDGRRFLIITPVEGTASPLTVVTNWQAGLKR